jgi:hypothetical protein
VIPILRAGEWPTDADLLLRPRRFHHLFDERQIRSGGIAAEDFDIDDIKQRGRQRLAAKSHAK